MGSCYLSKPKQNRLRVPRLTTCLPPVRYLWLVRNKADPIQDASHQESINYFYLLDDIQGQIEPSSLASAAQSECHGDFSLPRARFRWGLGRGADLLLHTVMDDTGGACTFLTKNAQHRDDLHVRGGAAPMESHAMRPPLWGKENHTAERRKEVADIQKATS